MVGCKAVPLRSSGPSGAGAEISGSPAMGLALTLLHPCPIQRITAEHGLARSLARLAPRLRRCSLRRRPSCLHSHSLHLVTPSFSLIMPFHVTLSVFRPLAHQCRTLMNLARPRGRSIDRSSTVDRSITHSFAGLRGFCRYNAIEGVADTCGI